jgi:HK97 family phage prohead protease
MLVRLKSETGAWESGLREMALDDVVAWMRKNTAEDGTLRQGIVLYRDAMLKSNKDNEFDWVMSDMTLDRDQEQIDPVGWDLKQFKQNPVLLWNHDWQRPAIGQVKNPHVERSEALRGTCSFDPPEVDAFAGMIAAKVRLGTISTGSVGFRPIKVEIPGNDETGASASRSERGSKPNKARLIYRKQELFEFSVCNIPANPSARVDQSEGGKSAVAWSVNGTGSKQSKSESPDGGIPVPEEYQQAVMDVVTQAQEKGVIPYADHGTEPDGTPWDAAKEVRDADPDVLKVICTWFDSSAADVKSSYKLPHHRAGSKKAVWKGVAAAMGALLGARGGVDIPDADRKGTYNHLAKHYKEFDKEPPEFRSALDVLVQGAVERLESVTARLDRLVEALSVAEPPRGRSVASLYFPGKEGGNARSLESLLPGGKNGDRTTNQEVTQ